jgi:hypothetical protein
VVSGKYTPPGERAHSLPDTAPWRRVSSSLVHMNPWFVVRKDDVLRPDGSHGEYQRVDSRGAVTVLAVDHDDMVFITRQWIYLHGLRARNWQKLASINCADSMTNHVDHIFLATDLIQGEPSLEPGEADLEVVRLPLNDAVALAMRNEIPDAGSAHGLVMFAARRAGLGALRSHHTP